MYLAKLKDKSGFSISEAMIAMALIGLAVVLIPQFLSLYNPRGLSVKRSCESYAQSVITAVQEESTYRDILQWMDDPNTRGVTSPTFPSLPRAISTQSDYWTPISSYNITRNPTAAGQPDGVRLNNAALIQGSVRTLSTIYNRNAGVRCTFGTYAPLTSSLTVPSILATYNPTIRINVEPYLLSTNAALCDTAFKLAAPRASSNSSSVNVFTSGSGYTNVAPVEASYYLSNPAPTYTMPNTYTIANLSNASTDLGFRLRVRVTYTANGATQTCEASQKFEYTLDNTPPAAPDIVEISANTSLSPTQENCTSPVALNAKDATIRIGYSTAPEKGTVLLCRDLSYIQRRNPSKFNPGTDYSGLCIDSTGIQAHPPPAATLSYHPFPRTEDVATQNWDPDQRSFSTRQNYWKPCDQLRICGVTADTATSTFGSYLLTLKFNSLPVGCIMNFEAVGADTAGNRSSATASPAIGRIFPSSPLTEGNIIFPPTCGNSTTCSQSGALCSTFGKMGYYGTNGYYIDRRGVWCKPTANVADDGNLAASLNEPNATLFWSSNTVGGANWRTQFPNGYYTCRGAFGGTGGAGGSGPNGCCWDPPGSTTCTPYN